MGTCISSPELKSPIDIKCYRCNRDQTVEYAQPICPHCKVTIAVLKTCTRCSEEYLARVTWRMKLDRVIYVTEYPRRCEACREYRECDICGAETLKRTCDDCYQTKPSCICCGETFRARFKILHGERYCSRCAKNVRSLVRDQPVLSQRLEVLYEVTITTHQSPCKEATEYTQEIAQWRRIYPITSEIIDPKRYGVRGRVCSKYCHGSISYRILSTQLI